MGNFKLAKRFRFCPNFAEGGTCSLLGKRARWRPWTVLSSHRTQQIAFLGETEPRAARPGRIPASDPITLPVGPTVNKAVTSHWACFRAVRDSTKRIHGRR